MSLAIHRLAHCVELALQATGGVVACAEAAARPHYLMQHQFRPRGARQAEIWRRWLFASFAEEGHGFAEGLGKAGGRAALIAVGWQLTHTAALRCAWLRLLRVKRAVAIQSYHSALHCEAGARGRRRARARGPWGPRGPSSCGHDGRGRVSAASSRER
eukprot:scaffold109416_cov33-Tisochrysis_lutea.AAC.3